MSGKRLNSHFFTVPLTRAAVVAALYVGLTLLFPSLSFLQVQFRIAECLCVLPFLFPETVWGLFFGCVIANCFSPLILPLDVVLGGTATLLAAHLTSRSKTVFLAPLAPVVCNALIVPLIFCLSATGEAFAPVYFTGLLFVAIGEIAVCYGLGLPLLLALKRLPLKNSRTKEKQE